MSATDHPNAEDYRNRAERAEQALAEMAGWDGLSLAVALTQCQAKLAAAEADADRLAEAGASCADDLEAEANNRWGYDERLARQLRRDLVPVVEFRQALALHNLHRIDG